MGRTLLPFLLAILSCGLPSIETARAQSDRRDRRSPELVIEAGGRMGTCDVLTFTPDGRSLMAVGDDKVVRIWPCGEQGLDRAGVRLLRWPIWREQRGSI